MAGLLKSSIATLQNAAASLVLGPRSRDHISDGLRKLHWLPVESGIRFKLCRQAHLVCDLPQQPIT
jgi:hypothetical protein